jgi:GNAT superfamily N-acetyltransferase
VNDHKFADIAVRQGTAEDASQIAALYEEGSGRQLSVERVTSHLAERPSAVASIEGRLVGFGFCLPFAPDIVELGNIFVAEEARGQRVGALLLAEIERQASQRYDSMIAVNSMLYVGVPGKRPADTFYLRAGYENIWSSADTRVFAKKLRT